MMITYGINGGFTDLCDDGHPDDFFRLSSMLYNTVHTMSFHDRMDLYPVLQDIVVRFEDSIHHSVIKSIQRFIDEELQPYLPMFIKETEYQAYLGDDDGYIDDDQECEMCEELETCEERQTCEECESCEELSNLRKGTPLRFDGLSRVSECESEMLEASYSEEHESTTSIYDDDINVESKVDMLSHSSELNNVELSLDDVKEASTSHKKSVKRSFRDVVRRISMAVRKIFT